MAHPSVSMQPEHACSARPPPEAYIIPSMINGNWSEASILAATKRCGMTPFVRSPPRCLARVAPRRGRRRTAPYFICGRVSSSYLPPRQQVDSASGVIQVRLQGDDDGLALALDGPATMGPAKCCFGPGVECFCQTNIVALHRYSYVHCNHNK